MPGVDADSLLLRPIASRCITSKSGSSGRVRWSSEERFLRQDPFQLYGAATALTASTRRRASLAPARAAVPRALLIPFLRRWRRQVRKRLHPRGIAQRDRDDPAFPAVQCFTFSTAARALKRNSPSSMASNSSPRLASSNSTSRPLNLR